MSTSRIIFHIDMNSYFASCEQQANPHLRGRPVGVCEHLGGIIIAPSVEAKRLGIRTATPVWEAKKICPDIILLPVDPPKYREITRRFLKIFFEYTDLVERYSIDEAFLDVTHLLSGRRQDMSQTPSNSPLAKWEKKGNEPFLDVTDASDVRPSLIGRSELDSESVQKRIDPNFHQDDGKVGYYESKLGRDALILALEIKWRIRREIGEWLTCSVGVAQNKLLAKIASDLEKPDGLTVIKPGDISQLYSRLRLTDIPGIGNRVARQLNLLGIFSIQELAEYPESLLRAHFGIVGHYLHEMGNFRGSALIESDKVHKEETKPYLSYLNVEAKSAEAPRREGRRRIKSMGHAYTMPAATADRRVIKKLLFKLSEKIAVRLRRQNFWGSEISCYVRFAVSDKDRQARAGMGRSHRVHDFTNSGQAIFKQAWKIFQSFNIDFPVRMVGVTVAGLAENCSNEPLFERYKKSEWALSAQDRINGKYGDFTLRSAVLIDALNLAPDTVGFGRMKEMSV